MQIENEYGPESKALGSAGRSYVNWAADMAVGLGTGVPWVMCKEEDAPDPVVGGSTIFYTRFFLLFFFPFFILSCVEGGVGSLCFLLHILLTKCFVCVSVLHVSLKL